MHGNNGGGGGGNMYGGFGSGSQAIHGKNGMTFIDRTHPETESE